jgi:hypothetical protein
MYLEVHEGAQGWRKAQAKEDGVEFAWERILDVVPICEPLRSTNGATESAPSGGAGDGVVGVGSMAALLLLVLLLLARSRSPALGITGKIAVV